MLKKSTITYITAAAQITLSVLFIGGYFFVMGLFLLGYVQVAPVWRDQIGVLLGVLTGAVMTIVGFWFSRMRAQQHKEDEHDPNAPGG